MKEKEKKKDREKEKTHLEIILFFLELHLGEDGDCFSLFLLTMSQSSWVHCHMNIIS